MGAIVGHGYGSGTGMDTFTLVWVIFVACCSICPASMQKRPNDSTDHLESPNRSVESFGG
jgi:hypothetical protein